MPLFKLYISRNLFLIFIAISLITTAGCSNPTNNQPAETGPTQQKQDKELTKDLTSEKIVQGGQVYFQGDYVIAVIIVKKGTKEKTVKDLAQKYANSMKKKYKDKSVNVQAVLDGKNVANITLE
jgi:hypothetical protein